METWRDLPDLSMTRDDDECYLMAVDKIANDRRSSRCINALKFCQEKQKSKLFSRKHNIIKAPCLEWCTNTVEKIQCCNLGRRADVKRDILQKKSGPDDFPEKNPGACAEIGVGFCSMAL